MCSIILCTQFVSYLKSRLKYLDRAVQLSRRLHFSSINSSRFCSCNFNMAALTYNNIQKLNVQKLAMIIRSVALISCMTWYSPKVI